MLEAITDFWKPAKKTQSQEHVHPEDVLIGSTIGFGFVPQVSLSGQRLKVVAINTYKFGTDALTSFVLAQEGASNPTASMIFAESEGEYYLAVSRRISPEERSKLFNVDELEALLVNNEISKLACRDNALPSFRGWLVPAYKREIQGMKGFFYRGDFRNSDLPAVGLADAFDYVLLVSESNEQAIEIEKYANGRIEVYATVYRRVSDIGEVEYLPVVPLAVQPAGAVSKPEPKVEEKPAAKAEPKAEEKPKEEAKAEEKPAAKVEEAPAAQPKVVLEEGEKTAPIALQEFSAEKLVANTIPAIESPQPAVAEPAISRNVPKLQAAADNNPAPLMAKPVPPISRPATAVEEKPVSIETPNNGAKNTMNNGYAETDLKPKLTAVVSNPPAAEARQEVRAVPAAQPTQLTGESIECDLRVANKIIDEAIRNEMRLTDVVRRIIELPVAYPESVQIPMTLTDEDYSLLAIRYGIPAADKNAIKRKIIEDLNQFSGKKSA